MLSTGKAAAHMHMLAGARGRLAGARADAWTAWCLRSAESVGAHARVEGRPQIESRQLVVGDDFLLWSRASDVAASLRWECVTRDVDDDTVVAGVPARAIRRIDYPDGCRKAWNNDWRPDHWPDAGYAPHA